MMKNYLKHDKDSVLAKTVNKQGKDIYKVSDKGSSSFSSFSEEEKSAYTKIINNVLANDIHISKFLPINPENMDMFMSLRDGKILCKLINLVEHKIEEKVINLKDSLNIFQMTENLNLAINSSKLIGCNIVGMNSSIILDQKYAMILGLLWQIIKQVLMKDISLKNLPQLIRLLKEGETLEDLKKLSQENLLLRWFNFHLAAAGHPDKITNFSQDVTDSVKYTVLLHQLDKVKCSNAALDESLLEKRAEMMLNVSKKLNVESYITPNDVLNGNSKLNTLFTAAIFKARHGLDPLSEKEKLEDEVLQSNKLLK